ncbi:MAG TPA: hypothetical protein VF171_04935 [Trueperaceae bacterium]
MRRLRGAVGMGVTWAIGWALVGIGIGVASVLLPFLPWQAFFNVFDAPLPALALPGFIGGVMFSLVLSVAARRRTFDQLSLAQVGAWGAAGGLLLSLVPATMVALGLASMGPGAGPLQLTALISLPLMLLSAGSAMATLRLAQASAGRRGPDSLRPRASHGSLPEKSLSAERIPERDIRRAAKE